MSGFSPVVFVFGVARLPKSMLKSRLHLSPWYGVTTLARSRLDCLALTIRAGPAVMDAFPLFIIACKVSMFSFTYCLSSPGLATVELLRTYTELFKALPGLRESLTVFSLPAPASRTLSGGYLCSAPGAFLAASLTVSLILDVPSEARSSELSLFGLPRAVICLKVSPRSMVV